VGHLGQQRGPICVISGCSSGGKSTLIAELGRRGYTVVDEPGRRIVKEELARGGSALPSVDGVAFARRAIEIALADRAAAGSLDGWVFFDRGLIDGAAALEHMTSKPVLAALGQGYEVLILPKVGVSERADFILNTLET